MLKGLFTNCDTWLVSLKSVNRDGCHMWSRICSLFTEHLIFPNLGSSWFHPFIIYTLQNLSVCGLCLRINDLFAWISLTVLFCETYTNYDSKNSLSHDDKRGLKRINERTISNSMEPHAMVQLKSPEGYLSNAKESLLLRVVSLEINSEPLVWEHQFSPTRDWEQHSRESVLLLLGWEQECSHIRVWEHLGEFWLVNQLYQPIRNVF